MGNRLDMSANEVRGQGGQPPEMRGQSRYDASLRLSVAPMMDWTDTERKVLQFSGLNFAAKRM